MRKRPGKLNFRTILAGMAATALAAVRARAQDVTGSVLYQMDAPNGLSNISDSGEPQAAADKQVVGYGTAAGNNNHAVLWSAPSGSPVDLTPTNLSGFNISIAYGTSPDGTQQVGFGFDSNVSQDHALLWTGSAASAVDLNPTLLSGFTASFAYGTNGSQQVGFGSGSGTGGNNNALLWNNTAASATDLNPTNLTGITTSIAYGINPGGTQQVGYASGTGTSGNNHAVLWNSTAGSAVDLEPTLLTGFSNSKAYGASATQQVGYGYGSGTGNNDHALLWIDTAASAVDLNPTGYTSSIAYGTNGVFQVGQGVQASSANDNALLWSGTAATFINLQSFLPASGTWTSSVAYTIDSSGDVFGVAFGTYDSQSGEFAVEWTAVPEPSTLSVMAASGIFLLRRRLRSVQPSWASV